MPSHGCSSRSWVVAAVHQANNCWISGHFSNLIIWNTEKNAIVRLVNVLFEYIWIQFTSDLTSKCVHAVFFFLFFIFYTELQPCMIPVINLNTYSKNITLRPLFTPTHPSIFLSLLIPEVSGWRWGYTLGKSPVYRRAMTEVVIVASGRRSDAWLKSSSRNKSFDESWRTQTVRNLGSQFV